LSRYSRTQRIPKESEHQHQVTLFQWAALEANRIPELALMFAIPNAGAGGQRGQAGKMKAEGVKAGVPDIFLSVARKGYHGLYIEMKMPGNKPTVKQRWWQEYLEEQEYIVEVCYSWPEAKDVIMNYLA
jgi:hypothetical protein